VPKLLNGGTSAMSGSTMPKITIASRTVSD
jgi:hypothetical protein